LGQERLHQLARLTPVPLYNVAVAYQLQGRLNAKAIEQAVRCIEERHDVLRTTFVLAEGKPVQRIAPAQTLSDTFLRVDLGVAPEANQSERVDEAVKTEITRAIDLAQGPLWRATLLSLSEREHVLVLTMHHIVTDGWSFGLFLKELGILYGAFEHGNPNPLGKLPLQYSEFAELQRSSLAHIEFESQRRYWTERLADSIPPLRLPTDRAGLPDGKRTAMSLPLVLSRELSQALMDLSQQESATLFITLLAGFEALLHQSTQQEQLFLCTPVTGRHRFHSKDLIGYFNNILPMRLDLSGDPSLLGLVRRTRGVTLEAFKNQDIPFQWNAELPSLRRIPLSRLLFSLDMEWPPKLELAGLMCRPMAVDTGAADFDLSVSLWMSQGQVLGNLRFKQDLFDAATIAKLSEDYRKVLMTLVEEPERKLSSLPRLVPAREQKLARVVGENEDPAANWPRTALELRLLQEWEAVFEIRPIGIYSDLRSLGASSLAVGSLAARIQSVFRTDLPITAIFQASTIEKMAALLQSRDKSLARLPLAPIQPRGTKRPLFLCEGVGVYYPLVPYLGEDQPIYGLVTEIVADFPQVEDLASHYVSAVLEIQPEGPYYLGGISFGGLVAFEMAQQLHSMGLKVRLLALMDTPGPGAYSLKPPLRRALGHASNLIRYGYPYLKAKMGRYRSNRETGEPSSAKGDPVRSLFEERAKMYQIRSYAGRITLFTLAQRSAVSDSLFDPALCDSDPLLGWGSIATDGVDRFELEGGHVGILREPFVRVLADRLRQYLDR
jgi:thioesterase domain-containing protein